MSFFFCRYGNGLRKELEGTFQFAILSSRETPFCRRCSNKLRDLGIVFVMLVCYYILKNSEKGLLLRLKIIVSFFFFLIF